MNIFNIYVSDIDVYDHTIWGRILWWICFEQLKRLIFFVLLIIKWCTDHEAPVIVCPVNQTVITQPSQANATVVWTDPQATDNSGQNLTIACDADSGNDFKIGETEVTCEAVDPTGNQATCTFTVKIEGNANWFWGWVSYDNKTALPYIKFRLDIYNIYHQRSI